jgi:hypothetical protein
MFKLESSAQNFVILINFLFGALGGTIILVLRIIEDTTSIGKVLAFVFRLIPSFSFSYGYNQLLSIRLLYAMDYPQTFQKMTSDPLSLEYTGMDVLFLGLEFIVYTIALILCEKGNNQFFCEDKSDNIDKVNVNDSIIIKEIERAKLDSEIGQFLFFYSKNNQIVNYPIFIIIIIELFIINYRKEFDNCKKS